MASQKPSSPPPPPPPALKQMIQLMAPSKTVSGSTPPVMESPTTYTLCEKSRSHLCLVFSSRNPARHHLLFLYWGIGVAYGEIGRSLFRSTISTGTAGSVRSASEATGGTIIFRAGAEHATRTRWKSLNRVMRMSDDRVAVCVSYIFFRRISRCCHFVLYLAAYIKSLTFMTLPIHRLK